MEEELVALLLADTAITDQVGDRINFVDRPGDTLPAVTLQVADQNTEYTHGSKDNINYPRVQADCWGRNYGETKLLARAVADRFEAGGSNGGVTFHEGHEINNSDMPADMKEGGSRIFRVMLEFSICWELTP